MWWHTVTHGRGEWRGNWRMKWVASTLTLPRNMMYPALQPLLRKTRLPAVDWTDAPADLNGLVRFAERRNLVSARVPSYFKRSLLILSVHLWPYLSDMRRAGAIFYSHLWPVWLYRTFPHYSEMTGFSQETQWTWKMLSYFLHNVWNISHSKKN